jgi:hypothetical protein
MGSFARGMEMSSDADFIVAAPALLTDEEVGGVVRSCCLWWWEVLPHSCMLRDAVR